VGYNPINGESYSTKDNVNSKQQDSNVKKPEEENTNVQTPATNSAENGHAQAAPTNSAENDNAQAAPANATEHSNVQKPDNTTSGNNAQKVRKKFSRFVILNSVVVRIKVIEYNCSMMSSIPFTRLKKIIM
jgi:hypothetical protein